MFLWPYVCNLVFDPFFDAVADTSGAYIVVGGCALMARAPYLLMLSQSQGLPGRGTSRFNSFSVFATPYNFTFMWCSFSCVRRPFGVCVCGDHRVS